MLMCAVLHIQPEIVKLLLEKGTDPTIPCSKGFTVLNIVENGEYLGTPEYKQQHLDFMKLQKAEEKRVKEWLQRFEKKYSPDMLAKRKEIKKAITEAYHAAQQKK